MLRNSWDKDRLRARIVEVVAVVLLPVAAQRLRVEEAEEVQAHNNLLSLQVVLQ